MRKFLNFYWQCLGKAARGNAPFANDWQWLIGYTALAILLWLIGFVWADFSGWAEVNLTNGAVGLFAAAGLAFLLTWGAVFVGRFLRAPADLFYEQKIRADALAERLMPKLTAIFDPKKPPCRSESEFRFSDGRNPLNGMCYRIEVKNTGVEMINDCEGYLTEVAFEEEAAELGVFNLSWSGMYPQALRVNLRPNVPRHLDLINIFENGSINIVSPGWPPNNRENFFLRHGHYRFTIVIGEAKSTLPPYKLRLNNTGDWQTRQWRSCPSDKKSAITSRVLIAFCMRWLPNPNFWKSPI